MTSIDSFPILSLVPKAETGVLNFLKKYPEFDGRNTTIAIFDSGVDPQACGLKTLPDGKSAKVIERFDCTGCGDVDVSTKVVADADGFILGLSGRQLKLTPVMISSNTANGEYRVGQKNFSDLYPAKVRDIVTQTNKEKHWDGKHKMAVSDATRRLNEFETQNTNDTSKLNYDKKIIKEDLDNTLEMLNNYEKLFMDVRTLYDCILYRVESGWQVCIDISEKGDLESAVFIGEYTKTHEIKTIDEYFSISVNVHDEGTVLEFVGMCSSHGTHVASIASGNHVCCDINGVAPGARIVSLTIGDARLGSMETGTALVRGMMKVMEMCRSGQQIDVINMSYGEHAHWSNSGRIGELMCEVVNKYGVVWVASAGNHGPALCTIGTPPDLIQSCCIGVGAYVSPNMMEAEYAMREKLPANVYTWTSRDPCIDGGQGVTVCAPGGAITSVPQFTMSKYQLMNGTSMAAPHVAGSIALIISGLKQKKLAYSPFSIKRSLCATATKLSYIDEFAQGSGLLNVEKAFEHLVQYENASETMLRFSVRCGPRNIKGILIREGLLKKFYEFNVNVEPVILNEKQAALKDKVEFNIRLSLLPSQPFVECGAYLDLSYSSRSVQVKINPTGLPPGVHSAKICAYDTECVEKGSLFEIPITVIQPFVLNCDETRVFRPSFSHNDNSIKFEPNTIKRDFILVPKQATWAILRMRSTDRNQDKDVGKFFIHAMQLLPKSSCRKMETMKIISVHSETEAILPFKVKENIILELCIAKYWSNLGTTHITYTLEFRGVQARNQNPYVMHNGRGIHTIEISTLVAEEIQPQVSLKSAAIVLRPTDSKISPLSAIRDVIPEGRQIYQNILSYTLSVSKAQEVALFAPIFNNLLYESEFESQIWMLFDSNKFMISCGDAHSHKFYSKLDKGEYTLKLQIRHEKRDFLEKVSDANMVAYFKMPSQISLDIYDHYNQCITNGRKYISGIVQENVTKVLYIGTLSHERLNKANLPNHCAWLTGTIILPKEDNGRRVDIEEFFYILAPNDITKKNGNGSNISSNSNSVSSKSSTTSLVLSPAVLAIDSNISITSAGENSSSPKKTKTADEYAEALRDFKCSMIVKCEPENARKIYDDIIDEHPQHSAAHLQLIQNIESAQLKVNFPFTFLKSTSLSLNDTTDKNEKLQNELHKMCIMLEQIVELAEKVTKEIDKDILLSHYGMKYDPRPDSSKIKLNMDKQKNIFLESLAKRGVAITKLAILKNNIKERLVEIDNIFTDIIKFTDACDSKVILFSVWHAYANSHYGRMSRYLQKMFEEKRQRDYLEELGYVAGAMKYNHLQKAINHLVIYWFPANYRLF